MATKKIATTKTTKAKPELRKAAGTTLSIVDVSMSHKAISPKTTSPESDKLKRAIETFFKNAAGLPSKNVSGI